MIHLILLVSLMAVNQASADSAATDTSLISPRPQKSSHHLTDSLPIYPVEGVTVIATRMPLPELVAPASVSQVAPDPVAPAAAITQLLGQTPSVNLGAYGGPGSLSTLSLRGAAGTDVLYMLDGQPLNSARDGTYDLNQLPADITHIEVLRGPAASLYGANAAAGAINFITTQPTRNRPYSKIKYQQGTFGRRTLEAMFSRNLHRCLGLEATGSWDRTDGQRINSDYDGLKYSFRLSSRPSPHLNGQAHYRYQKSENGNPGSILWPTPLERQQDRQEDLGLNIKYKYLSFAASQLKNWRTLAASSGLTQDQGQRRRAELGAELKVMERIGLQAGLSHQEDRDINTASGDHSLDQTSAFLSQSAELPLSLLLAASLRYDHASAYPSQLSPNIALGWNYGRRLSVHLGYGRSYRAPALVDLYWPIEVYPPYWGLATKISGNPDLRPEISRQIELGAKYAAGWLKASASVFQRKTRNLIDWSHTVFLPPDTSYTYPDNMGRVKATGFESWARICPLSWLSLEASYSYCRTVEDSTAGRVLPYRPLNVASASLGINDLMIVPHLYLGWKLSLNYSDRQTVRHQTDWGPGLELPRFLVADQTLSLKIRDARIFYTIDNLNNAEYQTRYGYPLPRRSHSFGIVMELWD